MPQSEHGQLLLYRVSSCTVMCVGPGALSSREQPEAGARGVLLSDGSGHLHLTYFSGSKPPSLLDQMVQSSICISMNQTQ